MTQPLNGYAMARADRLVSRLVVVRQEAGKKMFYVGGGTFSDERDAAVRFQRWPETLLIQFHDARSERS
jgi:hypothetical protein